MSFQICKKFCKILNNLMQNFCNLLPKLLSKKALNYQNLTTESGSKKKFVTRKSSHSGSLQSLFLDLKGGLWVYRKSLKILTASDQYFLS